MAEVKGFILAAGLGTRLQPLTHRLPKPLIPFLGLPIFDIALSRFKHAGITNVGANTHHLAAKLFAHTKAQQIISQEIFLNHEPEILGTGGFIKPIKAWLQDSSLLIFNGDIICDIDLGRLVEHHNAGHYLATMVLTEHKPGTTAISATDSKITAIGSASKNNRPFTFTGIHLISPEFMSHLPAAPGFHNIMDTYQKLISTGRISFVHHTGIWHDLGTPEDYFHTSMLYLQQFETIDAKLGIRKLWQTTGVDLEHSSRTIQPRHQLPTKLGPKNLVYSKWQTTDEVLHNCIAFASNEKATLKPQSNGITLDEFFIPIKSV